MKIALIDIPIVSAKESKKDIPSLTLGYLGAALLSAGHTVLFLDTARWKKSYESCYEKIITERPEVIGFTCTTLTRFVTINLIKKIKKIYSPLVITGGCHFTFTAKDALEKVKEIDIVVRGEGEKTIIEVIKAYARNEEYLNVTGVTYRDNNGKIIENPDRPFASFDSIMPPAWELFDLTLYNDTLESTNLKVIGLMSSRGCPQRCAFCANSAMGRTALRLRSPNLVVNELEGLHTKFGYNAFKFSDDTLTINKAHITEICNEIMSRNLEVKWSARVRANTVDEKLLDLMKKAGCVSLHYGVESGSQKILRMMQKGIKIEEVKKAVRLSASIGFNHIGATFMVSYPKETLEDLDCSFKLMQELKSYGSNIQVAFGFTLIYPGTEVERLAYDEGSLPEGFSWNSYYRAPKYFIAQCAETDIYYEGAAHSIEEIRAYISSRYASSGGYIGKIFKLFGSIHAVSDLPIALHLIKNMGRVLFQRLISIKPNRKKNYYGSNLQNR